MKKGFSIQAKGKKEVDIYIYEEIGAGWLGGISAKQFAGELKKAGDPEQINLRINSPGGSVFDGIAIYNELRRHKARVVVDIDGLAASIASVVAMAGDEIRMAENALLMIHDPWTVVGGSAAELRETADMMDKVKDSLVSTYGKQTGLEESEISDLMAAETWMSADEAMERGFISAVTEEVKLAACFGPDRLTNYKKVPPTLIDALTKTSTDTPKLDAYRNKRTRIKGFLKKRNW
jgi:ATP-dependent Clp endopeptidase proteolytic subunit ClpP